MTLPSAIPIMIGMKQSPLARVESLIRRVIEEPFTWLASDSLDPFRLASYLANAYHDDPAEDQPRQFTLYVSPQDYHDMVGDLPELELRVADYVTLLVERRGVRLSEAPAVRFEPDAGVVPRSARVIASDLATAPAVNTDVYAPETGDVVLEAIRAADAFLIVQGKRHVPLDRPVTRIGRRMDNDIVLEASSISRQHAQIRWRQRYFVLYDVSSHGRTAVNGMTTREHILRPGDVIALSDVMLVYGEGREDLLVAPPEDDDEALDTTLLKPGE